MSRIFCLMMLASVGYALLGGKTAEAAEALLGAGGEALELGLKLTGTMMLWCGLMEILCRAGDTARLGRLLQRVLQPLFPGMKDKAAWRAMGTNLAANMLGLGNAATPAGIEAARRLASPELGAPGLRALAMLLILNNSSLQWMPTTVMTLRAEAGSADPAGIWLPGLAASAVSTLTAAGAMYLLQRRERRREQYGNGVDGGHSGAVHSPWNGSEDRRI